ncbi:MAG: leucine-rich repeat domain-containing protein [Anaerovoracaceae bacterium]
MKKKLIAIIMSITMVMTTGVGLGANGGDIIKEYDNETTIAGIRYRVDVQGSRAEVVELTPDLKIDGGVLTIPKSLEYGGKTYPITAMKNLGIKDNSGIKEIVIQDVILDEFNHTFRLSTQNVEILTVNAKHVTFENEHGVLYYEEYIPTGNVGGYQPQKLKTINFNSNTIKIARGALVGGSETGHKAGKYDIGTNNIENINFNNKNAQVTIYSEAIRFSPKLKELNLPADTTIYEGALSNTGLEKIRFMGESQYKVDDKGLVSKDGILIFVPKTAKTVTVGKDIKKIAPYAFGSCTELKSVTTYAKEIGDCAFNDCVNLTSITLKDGTEKIGDLAFNHTGIKSLTLPKTINSIGSGIVHRTKNLTKIVSKTKKYKVKSGSLLSSSGKTLYGIIPTKGTVTVPYGVMQTKEGFLTKASMVTGIHFPSTITKLSPVGYTEKLRTIRLDGKKMPKMNIAERCPIYRIIPYGDRILNETDGKSNHYRNEVAEHVFYVKSGSNITVDVPNNLIKAYELDSWDLVGSSDGRNVRFK